MKNKFYLSVAMVAGYHQKLNHPDSVKIIQKPEQLIDFVNAALDKMLERSATLKVVFRPKGIFALNKDKKGKKFIMVSEAGDIPENESYFSYSSDPKEFLDGVLTQLREFDVNARYGYYIIDSVKDTDKFDIWCQDHQIVNTLALYLAKTPGFLDV